MSQIKQKAKKFVYRTYIKWHSAKRGFLSSLDKPDIAVATPPQFRGHAGIWTPEELFIASVNSCIMTTFLYYAERKSVEFLSYESETEGVLERAENQFIFSAIKVRPKVTVASSDKAERVKELIELSEKNCLISNSIKSKVRVLPEIKVEPKKDS